MDATVGDPLVGQLLDGRYRVGSRIARGGMATVYAGTDTRLDRTVALKIMHAELASDEEFVHRFVGEAKAVAQLSHPNVVAVFDQGSADQGGVGQLYLAMEYVRGHTLRHLLDQRGRLEPAEALDIFVPMLDGLGAAHRSGLVHRDMKPENVLLAGDKRVKVADFGLARAVASATSHTKTGMLIGTVAYIAPEQVTRSVVDARTDVYAAGIMLFEMLTGRQPHVADTPLGIAYKHVHEAVPPPSSIVPGLPPSLDSLVALATSRDPAQRPANAGQLQRAVLHARRKPNGTAVTEQNAVPASGVPASGVPASWAPGNGQRRPGTAPYGLDHPAPAGVTRPAASPVGYGTILPPVGQAGPHHTLVVPHGELDGPGYRHRGLPGHRVVYLAGAAAAALIVGLVVWYQLAGRFVPVPNVSGLSTKAAATELHNEGFSVKLGKAELSNQVAKGEVAATVPAIGRGVPSRGTITLIPSAGPHMINVPDVSGKSLTGAKVALGLAGLKPGTVTRQASDSVPRDTVVATQPSAGTSWPQPKPVGIVLSAGPGLPDFTGKPKAVAELWLRLHQLTWTEQPDTGSTQPPGVVTRQSPAPDTEISPGSESVTLFVSTGPQLIPVPDVTGMQVGDAVKALQQAGFQASALGSGTVLVEAPKGQAPRGSTITLWAPGVGGNSPPGGGNP